MEHVTAIREAGGPFKSLSDFAARVDPKLVNKRAFENSGARGCLRRAQSQPAPNGGSGRTRTRLRRAQHRPERESGQTSLFGGPAENSTTLRLPAIDEWPAHERLSEEFAAIGFYLSGHPLDAYGAALKRLGAVSYASLLEDRRRSGFRVVLAGTVIRKQERRGRNDQSFAFVSLSDPTGMFEVMVFSEALAVSRPLLEPGRPVLITAAADWDGEELKLRVLTISDLETAAADAGEGLRVRLSDTSSLRRSPDNCGNAARGL